MATWNPRSATRRRLEQVKEILDQYHDQLPLTGRQIFYRLVGAYEYDKTEKACNNLWETLNRARRAGVISFDVIRDDGAIESRPLGFLSVEDFRQRVREMAERGYEHDMLANQPHHVEVWCEAGGMVPQLATVAHSYGVPVFSSGGFDSVTVKYRAAERFANRSTVVLHIGDLDPSGCSIIDSLADDIDAFVEDMDGIPVEWRRVAVSLDQVERFNLPTAPAKDTDRRGDWQGGTVQAEALPPDALADELRVALEDVLDLDLLEESRQAGSSEREALLRSLDDAGW
jgi:hypothetical protein